MASFRYWRPLAVIDLALGAGVLVAAVVQLEQSITMGQRITFLVTLGAGTVIISSLRMTFAG